VCDCGLDESCLPELKRNPTVLLKSLSHSGFYLPVRQRTPIVTMPMPANRDLSYETGAGVNDVTIFGRGDLMLPALSTDQANQAVVGTRHAGGPGCISLRPMEA